MIVHLQQRTYLLTAIVAVADPVLDQVEVHLGWDDAAIVRGDLNGHPIHETLQELLLLIHEVFKCVN